MIAQTGGEYVHDAFFVLAEGAQHFKVTIGQGFGDTLLRKDRIGFRSTIELQVYGSREVYLHEKSYRV